MCAHINCICFFLCVFHFVIVRVSCLKTLLLAECLFFFLYMTNSVSVIYLLFVKWLTMNVWRMYYYLMLTVNEIERIFYSYGGFLFLQYTQNAHTHTLLPSAYPDMHTKCLTHQLTNLQRICFIHNIDINNVSDNPLTKRTYLVVCENSTNHGVNLMVCVLISLTANTCSGNPPSQAHKHPPNQAKQ